MKKKLTNLMRHLVSLKMISLMRYLIILEVKPTIHLVKIKYLNICIIHTFMSVQVHQIDQKDRLKRRLVYKKDQPKGIIKPTKKRSVEKKFKWKRKIKSERLE